jgi:type II secretory ATPase GspE/PulE/Tfp pilus assembly ATPase PilB-like protein
MITLRQDGLLKVLDGLTSIDEVERVTGELSKMEM